MILIIDDIERCESNVAKEYLFLIKEVATMRNCVAIFVTDYNVLLGNVEDGSMKSKDNDFLDKFFNYRIDLYDEHPEDIFAYYDKRFKEENSSFWSIYNILGMSLGTWYRQTFDKLNLSVQEQEEKYNDSIFLDERGDSETKLLEIKKERNRFIKFMQNPRTVVKFCKKFFENMQRCSEDLFSIGAEYNNLINKFVKERNVGQIVAFLSFVEVCVPDELQQIIKSGAEYIENPFYEKNMLISEDRRFLIEIAKATVYREDSEANKRTGYMKEEMRRFINRFLQPNAELYTLIKPFTTQEEEWKEAIEIRDRVSMDLHWNAMINMVIEKAASDKIDMTNAQKEYLFEALLEFAEEKVGWGIWEIDKVFSVFKYDNRGRLFASVDRLMQLFWQHLQKINVTSELSEKTVTNIKDFARYYSYYKVDSLYQLFKLITPYENSEKLEKYKNEMSNSERTLKENLSLFVDGMIRHIPNQKFDGKNWYEKYKIISNYIFKSIEKQGILEYHDIKKTVEHMEDSVDELYSMCKILEWVDNVNGIGNKELLIHEDYSHIDDTIQDFEQLIIYSDKECDIEIEKRFTEFFMYLKNSMNIRLTDVQNERLHNLITYLVEKTGANSLFYRKILLHKSLRNNEEDKKNMD